MSDVTILVGDARQRLAEVADQSVQCCVTSPPYLPLMEQRIDTPATTTVSS